MPLRALFEEVLAFQVNYDRRNTDDMKHRGTLIRDLIPAVLREVPSVQPPWLIEGRDATGLKAKVPWVRIYQEDQSPSAQVGWYAVYLFHEDGKALTLSLNQGTTEFVSGSFRRRDTKVLRQRAVWAHEYVRTRDPRRAQGLVSDIDVGHGDLARGYAVGHVLGFTYGLEQLPTTDKLLENLTQVLALLATLYRSQGHERAPGDEEPAVARLLADIDTEAGKGGARGAPRRMSPLERGAIERHAMRLATEHLVGLGWVVKDVSINHSFDLRATKNGEEIAVEVKGTTTSGEKVILTRNEVRLHNENFPQTCLILVSRIVLYTDDDMIPNCTGGVVRKWLPWRPEAVDLEAIGFEYRIPRSA